MSAATSRDSRPLGHRVRRLLLGIVGGLVVVQVLGVLFGPPGPLADWLAGQTQQANAAPRYVVILDGGGMPAAPTLLRVYRAAEFGRALTNATFVVALPSLKPGPASGVIQMRNELVVHGIPAARIQLEYRGLNTHQQAANVRELLGPAALQEPLVVVTSGYHMRRALLCFRHEGFTQVSGLVAQGADTEIWPGPLAWLRYGIWNNWEHSIAVIRELVALVAYKFKGWV